MENGRRCGQGRPTSNPGRPSVNRSYAKRSFGAEVSADGRVGLGVQVHAPTSQQSCGLAGCCDPRGAPWSGP
jgi:hypothetical protein